ncbi:MAG: EAL domain-containing protein [Actinomycetota bacterium]
MTAELAAISYTDELTFMDAVSALLHEAQRERGATSVYLASGGHAFTAELAGIRVMADNRLAQLLELEQTMTFVDGEGTRTARRLLQELAVIRVSVDRCSIGTTDAINYYDQLNLAYLDVVDTMISTAPSTRLRTLLVGHLALMRAKDLTGMERAVMSWVIGADSFDSGAALSLVSLLAAQESLLRIFDQSASERVRAQMAQLRSHPAVVKSVEMEMVVLRNGRGDFGIKPGDWFLASTQRIDLLRQVERRHLKEIRALDLADATEGDDAIEEALEGALQAMREIHQLVDEVDSGESNLRELVRGHETALDRAGFELAAAQRTARALAKLATTDPLTGLPNRSVIDDLIVAALDRYADATGTIALLTIDVDHFKTFNDSLGHAAGDTILRHVATRLRKSLRPGDIVARMGGDEFLIIADPIDDEYDAMTLARRLLEEIAEPVIIGGRELQVALSIGVAVAVGHPSAERLIGNSDLALYKAKREGRSRVALFDQSLREEADLRHEVGQGLRTALETGAIVPWYQPIIDLETGYPMAVEALARWIGPDGVRPAGEWISAAAVEGLLPAVSERVVDSALRQAPIIGEARPSVSVNVVAANLVAPGFAGWLERVLDHGDLEPTDVWVEITEQTAVDDPRAIVALSELRKLGCSIALDDFGTGFSALASLRELPIDIVKLDRSFLAGLVEDRQTQSIMASVFSIISTLGLRAVAEGVETKEELDMLRELGCDMAQGFVIGRPAPDMAGFDLDAWRSEAADSRSRSRF